MSAAHLCTHPPTPFSLSTRYICVFSQQLETFRSWEEMRWRKVSAPPPSPDPSLSNTLTARSLVGGSNYFCLTFLSIFYHSFVPFAKRYVKDYDRVRTSCAACSPLNVSKTIRSSLQSLNEKPYPVIRMITPQYSCRLWAPPGTAINSLG